MFYKMRCRSEWADSGYRVRFVSEQERLQQREEFLALPDSLGAASAEEIDRVLAEREQVEPEPELSVETISRFREMIGESRRINRAE
jgi:hypothetical protein